MGTYRPIALEESIQTTHILEELDKAIISMNVNRIGDVYKYDLYESLTTFKQSMNRIFRKCSVSTAIIEASTYSLCMELYSTGDSVFILNALNLLNGIIDSGFDVTSRLYDLRVLLSEHIGGSTTSA